MVVFCEKSKDPLGYFLHKNIPVSLMPLQTKPSELQSTKSVCPAHFGSSSGSQTPGWDRPALNLGAVPGVQVQSGSPNSAPFVIPSPSESIIHIAVFQT